jgi:hypothetical protein
MAFTHRLKAFRHLVPTVSHLLKNAHDVLTALRQIVPARQPMAKDRIEKADDPSPCRSGPIAHGERPEEGGGWSSAMSFRTGTRRRNDDRHVPNVLTPMAGGHTPCSSGRAPSSGETKSTAAVRHDGHFDVLATHSDQRGQRAPERR